MAIRITRKIQKILTLSFRDGAMVLLGAVLTLVIGGLIMITAKHEAVMPYQASGVTAAWVPPTVRHWDKTINEMAEKYDIDANLIAIIMTMESGGNPKAHSEADARGLMQVTPLTGTEVAAKHLKQPITKYDLYDPATSIEFGTAYLAWLRDEFGTTQHAPDYTRTVELIAAGYNGGPGAANALEQGEGLRDTQTVVYSRDAFNMWRERVSKTSPTYDRWKERGGQSLLDAAAKRQ